MIRSISVGIDVGTSAVKVVMGEFTKGERNPKVIGVGEAESRGVRHGYISNFEEAVSAVQNAVAGAEKTSGLKIRRAMISLGGASLRGETGSGSVVISKANGEVTTLDINKAIEASEEAINLNNKKIIHSFPVSYKLDGKEVFGRLEGMRGTKLEIKNFFITASILHLEDLLSVVAEAGVEPVDIIASPVAEAEIVLSDKEKIVGVALADIGAETVTLSVFENGIMVSLHTFSIGSTDITNDIALGLKIPLEKAESIKLGGDASDFPKKKLEEIIEARLLDIFESIDGHLKKIKRSELLPAGIVFSGGGAGIPGLAEFSKSSLKLPSRIGTTEMFGSNRTKLRDGSWFVALGLLSSNVSSDGRERSALSGIFKDLKNSLKSSLKQLMP